MKSYKCQNDYCYKQWYDESTMSILHCPYCGCEFVNVEEVIPKKKKMTASEKKKKRK